MIYDTLNNLPNYLGLTANLDAVIEFIMARDITALPQGRTKIDGERAFVDVAPLTPQPGEKLDFVRREQHLTLLTDLDGSELFEVALGELAVKKPYDPEADIVRGSAATSVAGMLCEGRFALFLAGEAYKAGIRAQGCGKVKQAVFLIQIEEDEPEDAE